MDHNIKKHIEKLKTCLLIPTYNHGQFLEQVITDCMEYPIDIIVVNDGSTDQTPQILQLLSKKFESLPQKLNVLHFAKNKGKGAALKKGSHFAKELGYESIISMDSDSQHYPSDMIKIIEKAIENPTAIIIGSRGMEHKNMPKKNSFANKFSNFWFHLQTNCNLPDTQSGFRYYPIQSFDKTIWFTNRYNFELEIMVRNIWKGRKVIPVPIHVYYPPEGVRVSHFRPTVDFLRITLLNTFLTIVAFFYFHPKKILKTIFN